MRLYTLNNCGAVADPETGQTYQTDRDGALDVPDALGEHLLATHFNGEKVWETGGERSIRLRQETEDGQRDPAALLAEMKKITAALTDNAGDDGPTAAEIAEAAAAAKAEADRLQKQADEAAAAEEKDRKAAEAAAAKEAKAKEAAEAKAAKEAKAAEDKAAKEKAAEAAAAAKAAKAATK